MKTKIIAAILLIITAVLTWGDNEIVARAETFLKDEKPELAIEMLETRLPLAGDREERLEYLIALAHSYFDLGKIGEWEGAPRPRLLEIFAQGGNYAEEAIRIDPFDYRAYFWRGSNRGKWGQIKGIFAALDQVKYMRDDFAKAAELNPGFSIAWFSLSQLYEKLPGGIISFGNDDFAVSLTRKAIDLMHDELEDGRRDIIRYDYYIELARQLHVRNWTADKRYGMAAEKLRTYRAHSDLMEKNFHYEGTKELAFVSDREEAREVLQWVIADMKALSYLDDDLRSYLSRAEEALSELF